MATVAERVSVLRHQGFDILEIAAILNIELADVAACDLDPARADSLESGSAAPTVIDGGDLGAAHSETVAANAEVWLTGTLTANLTLTLTMAAGSRCRFFGLQDATGGRSLTVTDDTTPQALAIPTDADAAFQVDFYSPDGDAIFVNLGSGGASVETVSDTFFFGEGSAPALVDGTAAPSASPPGYFRLGGAGGQVTLFGLLNVLAASASSYSDILSSNLPFLPPLPAGYEIAPALSNDDPNQALAYSVAIHESAVAGARLVTGYFYHNDPSFPDGFYLDAVASPPTADFQIYLSTISYLAGA